MLSKIKKLLIFFIFIPINLIRPLLGPPGCCIYTVTCRDYARAILETKPIYVSIPLILLRVLSCNPLTALILKLKNKFTKK